MDEELSTIDKLKARVNVGCCSAISSYFAFQQQQRRKSSAATPPINQPLAKAFEEAIPEDSSWLPSRWFQSKAASAFTREEQPSGAVLDDDDKDSVSSARSASSRTSSVLESVFQKTLSMTNLSMRSPFGDKTSPKTNERKYYVGFDDTTWLEYSRCVESYPDGSFKLHVLAFKGDVQFLLSTVAENPELDINEIDRLGCTPLHLSAFAGNTDVCESLLTLGADLTKVDSFGRTPLHLATRGAHSDVVSLLTHSDLVESVINLSDTRGDTSLTLAADLTSEHAGNILNMLIEAGADVAIISSSGMCPLNICCKNCNWDAAAVLIPHDNVRASGPTELGKTALHYAVEGGDAKIVSQILKQGAWGNVTDINNSTALHQLFYTSKSAKCAFVLGSYGCRMDAAAMADEVFGVFGTQDAGRATQLQHVINNWERGAARFATKEIPTEIDISVFFFGATTTPHPSDPLPMLNRKCPACCSPLSLLAVRSRCSRCMVDVCGKCSSKTVCIDEVTAPICDGCFNYIYSRIDASLDSASIRDNASVRD